MSFVFAEGYETRLSLAVYIVDDYTNKGGINARVSLEGCDTKPFKNPSGYYIFSGLPPKSYTVLADAGDNYIKCATPANLSAGKAVSLKVNLFPSPSYPFSSSDTLVRGSVRAFGVGVPEAKITVGLTSIVSGTDDRGDFVVAFKSLKSLVVKAGGKSLVRLDGNDPSISAEHPKYGLLPSKTVEIEEGRTTFVTIIYP